MNFTNGLAKDEFLQHMFEEFPTVFDNTFSRTMLENIVNYGTADNFTHTKNVLYYFLKDMIPEVEPGDLIPFIDKSCLTNEVLDNLADGVFVQQINGGDLNNSSVIRVGEKHIFTFLFNDGDCKELQNYNGCTGTVTHKWEKEQYIGEEPWEKVNSHGGLYEVVFEDGSEFDVYGDELQPVLSIDKKKLPLANRIQSASTRTAESQPSDKAPAKEATPER